MCFPEPIVRDNSWLTTLTNADKVGCCRRHRCNSCSHSAVKSQRVVSGHAQPTVTAFVTEQICVTGTGTLNLSLCAVLSFQYVSPRVNLCSRHRTSLHTSSTVCGNAFQHESFQLHRVKIV